MIKMTFFLILASMFLPYDDGEVRVSNGVYILNEWNLSNPVIKIQDNNFWIYNYGHAGRGQIGYGQYKIHEDDSSVVLKYVSIEGSYFEPKKRLKQTRKITINNKHKATISGYQLDSTYTLERYDSLYNDCLKYTLSQREILKRKNALIKVRRRELKD